MSLVGLSEVEQLRDANLRMAAGIEEMAARIERLEAALDAADVLRALVIEPPPTVWLADFRKARNAYDKARAALAGKEG